MRRIEHSKCAAGRNVAPSKNVEPPHKRSLQTSVQRLYKLNIGGLEKCTNPSTLPFSGYLPAIAGRNRVVSSRWVTGPATRVTMRPSPSTR